MAMFASVLSSESCCNVDSGQVTAEQNMDTNATTTDQEETVWQTYKSRHLESFTAASIAIMVRKIIQ